MALVFLRILNLRNIRFVEFEPAAGVNILLGENGAGKTSVLEAIYILGRGRSFRSNRAGPIIANGEESLEVFGRIAGETGPVQSVGVRKGRRDMEIRFDGAGIRQLSFLAKSFPQLIITPRSHEILERGPEYRRRFMDWGVFHVEHAFLQATKKYKRVLRQRNMALRTAAQELNAWDTELVRNGMLLDHYRQQYVEGLDKRVTEIAKQFLPGKEIALSYRMTAETEQEYLEKLNRHRDEELRRGFTLVGPHRLDLKVRFEGKDADKIASRGEQKLLISALFLAQARMVAEKGERKPIFLVDDLPAELDSKNRSLFLRALSALDTQVFITGTEKQLFGDMLEAKLFHVEHGGIS